jgi:TatD DNase family protein
MPATPTTTWPRILTEEHARGAFACVMHCFSSGAGLARAALDLGFYLSMSGIAAFPKSDDLRAIFAAAPVERILVETDAPIWPAAASRRRNEPAYTAHTARAIAELFGWTMPISPRRPRPISTGCSPRPRHGGG